MEQQLHQIELPVLHFARAARREYRDWRQALVREFLQNAVDAGARNVRFTFDQYPDYCNLGVVNDGRALSLQDCRARLRTLGGSDKAAADTVGGFGVAKQLLYFAWSRWSIRSADYCIEGQGCRYQIEPQACCIQGVENSIQIDRDPEFEQIALDDIERYLQHCCCSATLWLNGREIQPVAPAGRTVQDLGWGRIRRTRTSESSYLRIRVAGVTMFSQWVGDAAANGRLSLDLDPRQSRTILTSNRDGLRQQYSQELDALLRNLAINPRSALRDRQADHFTRYEGCGLLETKLAVPATTVTPGCFEAPQGTVTVLPPVERMTPETLITLARANLQLTNVDPWYRGSFNRIKLGADYPTVLIKTRGTAVPRGYAPNQWSRRTQRLMVQWSACLRQILLDNQQACRFGIGLTFDPDQTAAYCRHEGQHYFLLNPRIWSHGTVRGAAGRHLRFLELKQRAVHEIAHLVEPNHNENFCLLIEALDANTWANHRAYRTIERSRTLAFGQE